MTAIENVTLIKRANIYFDGKVTSRKIILADGSSQTFGIMLPGEYTFKTDVKEKMAILNGKLRYKLVGSDWQEIDGSGVFYVPAGEEFNLVIEAVTDYACSYIDQ